MQFSDKISEQMAGESKARVSSGTTLSPSDWVGNRGLYDVSAFNEGQPAVIRVSSVVDEAFPTLFWLIDAEISLKIDRLEAVGWIAKLQEMVNESTAIKLQMKQAHEAHNKLRHGFLGEEERLLLNARGMMSALSDRGIGGIQDRTESAAFTRGTQDTWLSPIVWVWRSIN